MKKIHSIHPNTLITAVIVGASIAMMIGTVAGYGVGYDQGWLRAMRAIGKGTVTDQNPNPNPSLVPTTFEECMHAGHPVMESHPRQCRTPNGALFVEDALDIAVPPILLDEAPREGRMNGGCAIGGCSAHLCADAETAGDLVSTCEFRPEYACYRSARCERQTDGMCGWTKTEELMRCLSQGEMQPQ